MFSFRINQTLELRPISERDAEPMFAVINRDRDHLRRWLPWVDGTQSVEDSRSFCGTAVRQSAANNGFHAGVWHDGNIVGVIGHHGIDWSNRRTSIGYWLAKAAQGRGIMTAACRAVVDYNFKSLDLNRIEIRCATENHRSRAIPHRLAFKLEGVIRQAEWLYDHFVDHEVYSMLKAEWEAGG